MERFQRFAVLLKGEDEPVEVQTTARDWRRVQMDGDGGGLNAVDAMYQVVHAALVREDVAVPLDYDGFLDVLDGMPEVVAGVGPDLNPTGAAPSGGPP